jgi:hypothetical protein
MCGRDEENHETFAEESGDLSVIRTWDLPNMKLVC